jgi:hypothetical protein
MSWYFLKGEEEWIRHKFGEILEEFQHFVMGKLKPGRASRETKVSIFGRKKSGIEEILQEYKEKDRFTGQCKEASLFFSLLCDAKGIPNRRVLGKVGWVFSKKWHVWNEVAVPTSKGYAWTIIDCTSFTKSRWLFTRLPRVPLLKFLPSLLRRKKLKLRVKFTNGP